MYLQAWIKTHSGNGTKLQASMPEECTSVGHTARESFEGGSGSDDCDSLPKKFKGSQFITVTGPTLNKQKH